MNKQDKSTSPFASLFAIAHAVLLSPACASLDMYKNYAHRAQAFVDAVQGLPS